MCVELLFPSNRAASQLSSSFCPFCFDEELDELTAVALVVLVADFAEVDPLAEVEPLALLALVALLSPTCVPSALRALSSAVRRCESGLSLAKACESVVDARRRTLDVSVLTDADADVELDVPFDV